MKLSRNRRMGLPARLRASNQRVLNRSPLLERGNDERPILEIAVRPFARHGGDAVVLAKLPFIERLMCTPLAYAAGYGC